MEHHEWIVIQHNGPTISQVHVKPRPCHIQQVTSTNNYLFSIYKKTENLRQIFFNRTMTKKIQKNIVLQTYKNVSFFINLYTEQCKMILLLWQHSTVPHQLVPRWATIFGQVNYLSVEPGTKASFLSSLPCGAGSNSN